MVILIFGLTWFSDVLCFDSVTCMFASCPVRDFIEFDERLIVGF